MALNDDLWAYYPLGDRYDYSGNGCNLTATGQPAIVTGKSGRAAQFAGDSYFTGADPGSLTGLSIAAWVSSTASGIGVAIGNYSAGGDGVFRLITIGALAVFQIRIAGTDYNGSATFPNDGTFHFLVGTWDGATVKISVDNVLSGTTATTPVGTIANGYTFRMGATLESGFGVSINDEVGMWTRALSTGEQDTLWNSGAGYFGWVVPVGNVGPNMAAMYTFLEAMASATIDACEFTFTGGDFIGQKAWQAGGGVTYAGYVVHRDQAMMMRAYPSKFLDADIARAVDIGVKCQGVIDDGIQTALTINGAVVGYGANTNLPSDLDDGFEIIDMALQHARRTGSPTKWLQHETALLAAYNYVPADSHLAYIDPLGSTPPGWGFNDSEIITGHDAMLSILRYRACAGIAELYTMAGDATSAAPFITELPLIRASMESLLYDGTRGLLKFGTGAGNANNALFSLHASAYAVVVGAVPSTISAAISQALAHMVPGEVDYVAGERAWIAGQQRHFPSVGGFSVWRNSGYGINVYQNGGGWATMTGASLYALHILSPQAAFALLDDWVTQCTAQSTIVRPVETTNGDGTVQATVYGASNQPFQFARYIVDGDPFDQYIGSYHVAQGNLGSCGLIGGAQLGADGLMAA